MSAYRFGNEICCELLMYLYKGDFLLGYFMCQMSGHGSRDGCEKG